MLSLGVSDVCKKQKIDKLLWHRVDTIVFDIVSNSKWNQINFNGSHFNMKPFGYIWNPECFNMLDDRYIGIDIVLKTEEILDSYTNKFSKEACEIIGYIISIFSNYFTDSVIFFSEEKVICKIAEAHCTTPQWSEDIWSFDLAILPSSLEFEFLRRNNKYVRVQLKNKVIFIKENSWHSISDLICYMTKALLD